MTVVLMYKKGRLSVMRKSVGMAKGRMTRIIVGSSLGR